MLNIKTMKITVTRNVTWLQKIYKDYINTNKVDKINDLPNIETDSSDS